MAPTTTPSITPSIPMGCHRARNQQRSWTLSSCRRRESNCKLRKERVARDIRSYPLRHSQFDLEAATQWELRSWYRFCVRTGRRYMKQFAVWHAHPATNNKVEKQSGPQIFRCGIWLHAYTHFSLTCSKVKPPNCYHLRGIFVAASTAFSRPGRWLPSSGVWRQPPGSSRGSLINLKGHNNVRCQPFTVLGAQGTWMSFSFTASAPTVAQPGQPQTPRRIGISAGQKRYFRAG
jgi:hypothetical protein